MEVIDMFKKCWKQFFLFGAVTVLGVLSACGQKALFVQQPIKQSMNMQEESGDNIEVHPESWMKDLQPNLLSLPLNEIIFPGTHDSATYSLSSKLRISNELNPSLAEIEALIGKNPFSFSFLNLGRNVLNSIIKSWGKTQTVNIAEQLTSGIRYLDLRICSKNGEIRVCHGLFGDHLSQILDQVSYFLENHPKEVVILDFNHLNDVKIDRLTELLNEKMLRYSVSSAVKPTSTLSDLYNTRLKARGVKEVGYAIILIDDYQTDEKYSYFWSGPQQINSYWPEKNDSQQLLEVLSEKRYRDSQKFYVTQAILTETGGDIKDNISRGIFSTKYSKEALLNWQAEKNVPGLILDWFEKQEDMNIIIVDDFQKSRVVQMAINMNKNKINKTLRK